MASAVDEQSIHHGSGEALALALVERLRELIRVRLANGRPHTLRALAKALALSPRTLQRRLQAQGTHYARVLREERETTARMLALQGRRRDAMANALGYHSTRSVDRLRSLVRGVGNSA